MKRLISTAVIVLLGCVLVAASPPAPDIKPYPSCPICGMNRLKFNFSRVYAAFEDKSSLGTCSMFCLGAYMVSHLDKIPTKVLVADFFSTKLINASKAFWVIVDNKPGVMTKKAKWAFLKRADAQKYIKKNGGRPITYDQVMKDVFCGMYQDLKMIQQKRKRMRQMRMKKKH